MRIEIAQAGFAEVLTYTLCSIEDCFGKLRREWKDDMAVRLCNPKTKEFQIVRTTLLPGLLKTINNSKKVKLPIKLFEVADVVLLDESTDTGARNVPRIAVCYAGMQDDLEIVHGALDRIMRILDVEWDGVERKRENAYYLKKDESNPTFLPGRCAGVFYRHKSIGHMGVVHPEVLENYKIQVPCSYLEIDLEPFL